MAGKRVHSMMPAARRYIVPVYRPFPIWRFGSRRNLFGEPLPDGWYPDRYRYPEFAAEADATAFVEAATSYTIGSGP